jgi:hypothetical protein
MISDVLSYATESINEYLLHFPEVYPMEDVLTLRIRACVEEMNAIRTILDTPPRMKVS